MSTGHTTATALRDLLRDGFGRIAAGVGSVCEGLTVEQATYRPDPEANTIAWLVWHLTRIQDDHVAGLAGTEQVWTGNGWYDRFGLPFDSSTHGYGQTSDDVAQVRVDPVDLTAYHADVHAASLAYVDRIDAAELGRVVDDAWDPPVTAAVRMVSLTGDAMQHLGQAAYVRGLAERSQAVR